MAPVFLAFGSAACVTVVHRWLFNIGRHEPSELAWADPHTKLQAGLWLLMLALAVWGAVLTWVDMFPGVKSCKASLLIPTYAASTLFITFTAIVAIAAGIYWAVMFRGKRVPRSQSSSTSASTSTVPPRARSSPSFNSRSPQSTARSPPERSPLSPGSAASSTATAKR